MPSVDHLKGKPLVVYIDGEKKQIGVITGARLVDGGLFIGARLDKDSDLVSAAPPDSFGKDD